MAYEKIGWKNGQAPLINDVNLNKMDDGIKSSHDEIAKIKDGRTEVANANRVASKSVSVSSTADTAVLRDANGDIETNTMINFGNHASVNLNSDNNDFEITLDSNKHHLYHGGNLPSPAQYKRGSDTFLAATSEIRVDDSFVDVNTMVTISPKEVKENFWSVESFDGYFVISSLEDGVGSSNANETKNVSFDWSAVKGGV